VLLTLHQQWRQHGAAVVHGHVAYEAHLARAGVDLDHGDVGTERERGALLVEVELAARPARPPTSVDRPGRPARPT
jgi:hypothetical protein